MTEYTLIVNGVELPAREIEISTKEGSTDPLDAREVRLEAKDCVIPSDSVGELLDALAVDAPGEESHDDGHRLAGVEPERETDPTDAEPREQTARPPFEDRDGGRDE